MKARQLIIPILLLLLSSSCQNLVKQKNNYINYHMNVISAEKLISEEKYEEALKLYGNIFKDYSFIFLRDYKITSQLSIYTGQYDKGLSYINKAIIAGWELDSIKTNKFFLKNLTRSQWKTIELKYDSLHQIHLEKINPKIRNQVEAMYQKDQELAYNIYLIESEDEQQKYITEYFSPHSENQLKKLLEIIQDSGYPGELLIGNDYWMSTILSHHNSISQSFVKKDTSYSFIKPKLYTALNKGQISPYEFAMIEDWRLAVIFENNVAGYGFLNSPQLETIEKTDENRNNIGLRSVDLRNKLVDIERKTGLNLFLPNWIDGKIKIN